MQNCFENIFRIVDFHQLLVVTPLRISHQVFQENHKICTTLEHFLQFRPKSTHRANILWSRSRAVEGGVL